MNSDISLSDSIIERIPPQSIDSEQAVLGGLLMSGDAISRVVDLLDPEYFYRKSHQVIYAAIKDLFEKSEPIDIITVSQFLKDEGKLEHIGGRQYLTDLALSVATTANIEYYAKSVHEKALLRNLIKAGTEIVAGCYEDADADSAIDNAEHLIFGLAQRKGLRQLVHIRDIVEASFAKIEERYENKDTLSGMSSGFYDLDTLTSGFQPSDLIIVAARPSMGKCLAYDSEIVQADGSITTIEELYKSKFANLLTLDDSFKLIWTTPSMFVDDGIKPVYKVTTRLGRTIETTLAHPFLTTKGWQKLEALRVGQKIAVPRVLPAFGSQTMRECEIKLLAYLMNETCPTKEGAIFTNTNPVIQKDFDESLEMFGQPGVHELQATSCHHKSIPLEIFKLEKSQVALFLNRLFAIAGWALTSGQCEIGYKTESEKCARQIQHLLLRFGILSKLQPCKVKQEVVQESHWQIEITDRLSLYTFIRSIGIFSKELPLTHLLSVIESDKYEDNRIVSISAKPALLKGSCYGASDTRLPAGKSTNLVLEEKRLTLNEPVDDSRFRNQSSSDIYWDEIISIESAGKKQVYDLTVPETHNFIANDICVHNTAFCLNIAQSLAVEKKIPVAIFSLEMSKEQLVQRMLCSEASIDANKLRTGFLQNNDWNRLAMAMGRLGEAPIFIDDSAILTALDIRAKSRRLKAEWKGLGLIIVDYIQLMAGRKATDNRQQEVSEISRSLKTLARELECPVIALSQLSRAVEARQNKRPMLSDLRESGSIEQDADLVMFIYRDEYYNPESEHRGEAEIIIAKQRNGPTGTVDLLFQASITRFLNKVHGQYAPA